MRTPTPASRSACSIAAALARDRHARADDLSARSGAAGGRPEGRRGRPLHHADRRPDRAAADQGVPDLRAGRAGQICARRRARAGGAHDQRGARRPRAVGRLVHGRRRRSAPAGRLSRRRSRCRARRACRPSSSIRNKRWVATNLGVRSAAYNTKLVPKEHAPHSYQDLLDPRWKGKIVWNPKSMTGAWGFISTVIKGMGDEPGMAYLRALAKQDIVPLPIAIRAVLDRVIARRICDRARDEQHACRDQRRARRAGQMGAAQSGERDAAGRRHRPRARAHPNAARLFIDFMVSKAGQEIFRDNDYLPMHPDVPAKIPELKPEQGGYRAVVYTPGQPRDRCRRAGRRSTTICSADGSRRA